MRSFTTRCLSNWTRPCGHQSAARSRSRSATWSEPLAGKVLQTWEDERRLAARDRGNLDRLKKRLGRRPLIEIPHLEEDVHDLRGLGLMDEYLFAD